MALGDWQWDPIDGYGPWGMYGDPFGASPFDGNGNLINGDVPSGGGIGPYDFAPGFNPGGYFEPSAPPETPYVPPDIFPGVG